MPTRSDVDVNNVNGKLRQINSGARSFIYFGPVLSSLT